MSSRFLPVEARDALDQGLFLNIVDSFTLCVSRHLGEPPDAPASVPNPGSLRTSEGSRLNLSRREVAKYGSQGRRIGEAQHSGPGTGNTSDVQFAPLSLAARAVVLQPLTALP